MAESHAIPGHFHLDDEGFLQKEDGLPGVSKDNSIYAIKRIQKALDEHRIMIDEHESAQVGISIGAATFPEDGREPDILLVVADQAMYKDKAARQKKKYPSEVIRFRRGTADTSS